MNISDTDILDFLQNTCKGHFHCEQLFDPYVDSPTHGWLNKWRVFTVPSQHVTGSSVREALSNAIIKTVKGVIIDG